jgi:hypothetical protein
MPEITEENFSNNQYRLFVFNSWQNYLPWILMLAVFIFTLFQLHLQGRIWWCKWDTPIQFGTFDAWSKHTSQHFIDPYFFTHVLHGFLFLWILNIVFNTILNVKISKSWLLFIAVFAESAWEVLENSTFIIERYRENTASLDYLGDSIANSIGDIIACSLGFIIAYELKFWRSLALFFLIEIMLILTIHDSLLINIIMLIHPIEALKTWQTGS